MTYHRVLTDAQVAWVRAIQSKQDQLKRVVARSPAGPERAEALRQLRLLPTRNQQAESLGCSSMTIIRIRRGHEYVAPSAHNVPRESQGDHHAQA
jgi:hypothetical protein